jgi:RNA polymerase sigma-70 factor (ECF subfamily)
MMTGPIQSGPTEPADDLTLSRQGDADAFGRLAVAHDARLFRQAVGLCGNLSVAEDLAAETLIEAWRSLPRFRGGCRFSTWLYGILVHRYQKHVRRQQSRPPSLGTLPASDASESEDRLARIAAPDLPVTELVERHESAHQLRQAVDQLPPVHQAVILLRFFEHAQLPEIAAALRIPLGTAKSRLHNALERLRQMPDVVNLLSSAGDSRI